VAQEAADEADASYELVYKFKPGETLRWEVTNRATTTTTIRGTTQTVKTLSNSVKAWQVADSSTESELEFIHLVESVKMANQISGRAMVQYDSQTDATPPAGYESVAKTIGVPLTQVKMTQYGKVIQREEKAVQAGNRRDTPIAIPLPEEPVKIGATWDEPHDITVQLPEGKSRQVSTRRHFQLKSVKTGVATITTAYQVLTPINNAQIKAQLLQRLHKGEIRFDIDAGRVISQQLDIDDRAIGFSGPASSTHYLMRFEERLLKSNERVATKPPQPAGPPLPPK
jgi:hypothetical protein